MAKVGVLSSAQMRVLANIKTMRAQVGNIKDSALTQTNLFNLILDSLESLATESDRTPQFEEED